ncbi:MAG: hypothetical protein KGS61_02100 [Verrucomicrobia bacterium]|nr:hypothetical protein [Verrucomicrobiota bacterium]
MNTNSAAPLLFSYVVDHDLGYAPNPFYRSCILSHCKFDKSGRRSNLIESARKGDWIVGTGGKSNRTAPHGKIIFAMQVEEKPAIGNLFSDERFARQVRKAGYRHVAHVPNGTHGKWFLVAFKHFYYFGRDAIDIPSRFRCWHQAGWPTQRLEKLGPRYKRNFSPEFIQSFVHWIKRRKPGRRGRLPVGGGSQCVAVVGGRCHPRTTSWFAGATTTFSLHGEDLPNQRRGQSGSGPSVHCHQCVEDHRP